MHRWYSDVIDSCPQLADVCIPKTGHNKHNNVPSHNITRCSEHVQHLRQNPYGGITIEGIVVNPITGM